MPARMKAAQGRRGVLGLVVAAAVAGGCKKERATPELTRDRDAQAVVVIEAADRPELGSESEPNDDMTAASVLVLGAGARGTLATETDVDTYRIAVAGPGVLSVRLAGIEGVDLILDLLDATGTQLARSDRGPAQVGEGIPNFRVVKGDYYLVVSEFVKKRKPQRTKGQKGQKGKQGQKGKEGSDAPAAEPAGRTEPSQAYELLAEVAAEPAEDHEHEPNEGADGALELLTGDEALGYMGWSKDVDMWKLSVEGFTDQYSLDLDISGVPDVTLSLDVLDSNASPVLHYEGQPGSGLAIRNLVPVPSAAPGAGAGADGKPISFYYAKLTSKRSNPGDPYRLRVSTRLLELDEEIEPNDRAETAMPLRAEAAATEGKRRGFLTLGDTDHYRLEAGDSSVLLTVQVTPGDQVDAVLELSSAGGVLGMADAGKRGSKEYLAAVRIPAGQAAVVKVGGHGGEGTGAGYELTWSIEPDDAADTVLDEYED